MIEVHHDRYARSCPNWVPGYSETVDEDTFVSTPRSAQCLWCRAAYTFVAGIRCPGAGSLHTNGRGYCDECKPDVADRVWV